MSYAELIKDFFRLDGETLDAYCRKCIANGWLYTGRFYDGQPELVPLQ